MRFNIQGVIGDITPFPGCGQIAVSHGVFLPEPLRGAGVGLLANNQRQTLVFDTLGYDLMLCTVDETNSRQKHILEKTGWSCLKTFKSSRTGNTLGLWSHSGAEHEEHRTS